MKGKKKLQSASSCFEAESKDIIGSVSIKEHLVKQAMGI